GPEQSGNQVRQRASHEGTQSSSVAPKAMAPLAQVTGAKMPAPGSLSMTSGSASGKAAIFPESRHRTLPVLLRGGAVMGSAWLSSSRRLDPKFDGRAAFPRRFRIQAMDAGLEDPSQLLGARVGREPFAIEHEPEGRAGASAV